MHAGTQTLIQALQAIPWTDDPDHYEEPLNHGPGGVPDSDSDDEEHLASSIHTIYRPLARSRSRRGISLSLVALDTHNEEVTSETEGVHSSPEDLEAEDFERTPRVENSVPHYARQTSQAATVAASAVPKRMAMSRTGSMATVRLQRRAKLAEKLKEVFDLHDIDEVWAEMPCWLLRSICESCAHIQR